MALLFNYNVLLRVMEWFGFTLEQAWFLPILWPSMMIQSLIYGTTKNIALYGFGSLLLFVSSFFLGTYARQKYWVPKPITIELGPREIRNERTGIMGSRAEQAIFMKDLKALFRRKEMMTFLAIPFMLFAVNFIQMDVSHLWDESAGYVERLGVFLLPGMGLYMLSLYVSMVSIGQEGSGFINLQFSPLKTSQIFFGKVFVGWVLSAILLFAMLLIERVYIGVPPDAFWGISVVGFATITEASFLGLMFGSMFPDFTEVPRSRFTSSAGSLISVVGSAIVSVLTIAPILMNHYIYGDSLSFWLTGFISLALMSLVCWVSFRQASSRLEALLLAN
jgi:hypothetical protein